LAASVPARPLAMRALSVPVGDGGFFTSSEVKLIAIGTETLSDGSAKPPIANELLRRRRASDAVADDAADTAERVTAQAIQTALGKNAEAGIGELPATTSEAALRIQAIRRGSMARRSVGSTQTYIKMLEAGQQANRAGKYGEARDCFLEAYALSGRAEPMISAANMLLKLFMVEQAVGEYHELLALGKATPDFLNANAAKVVHRRLGDAQQLQRMMARGMMPAATATATAAAVSSGNGSTLPAPVRPTSASAAESREEEQELPDWLGILRPFVVAVVAIANIATGQGGGCTRRPDKLSKGGTSTLMI